ncbi:HflC protein [bacterium]|nr:HflC protein [bacterium]|tara:strand:+ start:2065 stop:3006 length:942 start_codon:yes stop_codon:yes gene_type:complete
MKKLWLIIFFAIGLSSVYVVDETEQVIITQFGEPVGDTTSEPGLYFKIPFIQKANRFSDQILEWDGFPEQVPTLDKTFIFVDTVARWRITDPLLFFQSVVDERGAQSRLDDILDSVVRNVITGYDLIETVRSTDRSEIATENLGEDVQVAPEFLIDLKLGRDGLENLILEQSKSSVLSFGIELIDIRIKHLNYVESVQKTVFSRMISERERIAEKFKSEGQGEAAKIMGDMEKELLSIQSEAYSTAEQIKGEADASATQIYADAYEKSPEFYRFWKLLAIYENMTGQNLSLILTNEGAFYDLIDGKEFKRTVD